MTAERRPANHALVADRERVLVVTYNRVDNLPVPRGAPRPDFLVSRDTRALAPAIDPRLA